MEELIKAAKQYAEFNLPSEGMPHIGSQAWQEAREQLLAAIQKAEQQ
jgi:hypothetical protein